MCVRPHMGYNFERTNDLFTPFTRNNDFASVANYSLHSSMISLASENFIFHATHTGTCLSCSQLYHFSTCIRTLSHSLSVYERSYFQFLVWSPWISGANPVSGKIMRPHSREGSSSVSLPPHPLSQSVWLFLVSLSAYLSSFSPSPSPSLTLTSSFSCS